LLRHVVSWKLAAEDGATKVSDAETIAAALTSLPALIPEIRSLNVGSNVAYPETNWDLVLIADYDDQDGLEAYQVHPEHVAVANIIRPLVSQKSAVDFLV
jgi:Stress responsive A/B Barrel Domain